MVAINPGHPVAFLKTYSDSSLIIGTVRGSPVQAMLSSDSHEKFIVGQGTRLENLIGGFVRLGTMLDEEQMVQFRSISPKSDVTSVDVLCYHGMQISVSWNQARLCFDWDVLMRKGDYRHSFNSEKFADGYEQLRRRIEGDYLDITRNAIRHIGRESTFLEPEQLNFWYMNKYLKACRRFEDKLRRDAAKLPEQ